MARSASGPLRDRWTVTIVDGNPERVSIPSRDGTWPASRPAPHAGPCPDSLVARAKTLAPRVYAASEPTPSLLHAELDVWLGRAAGQSLSRNRHGRRFRADAGDNGPTPRAACPLIQPIYATARPNQDVLLHRGKLSPPQGANIVEGPEAVHLSWLPQPRIAFKSIRRMP
jgi:hypothetical protein